MVKWVKNGYIGWSKMGKNSKGKKRVKVDSEGSKRAHGITTQKEL